MHNIKNICFFSHFFKKKIEYLYLNLYCSIQKIEWKLGGYEFIENKFIVKNWN